MKKLLLIALLFVGCTTEPETAESNLIDREFVVLAQLAPSDEFCEHWAIVECALNCCDGTEPDCGHVCNGTTTQVYCDACDSGIFDCAGICDGLTIKDCAGVCGGGAVEQTLYCDNDGDGLGGDVSREACSVHSYENWVLNSEDDDDTAFACYILNTLGIVEADLVITNGILEFSYNEEDFSVDISSCVEKYVSEVTRIIQDTELKILYVSVDEVVLILHYSSPNELSFIQ